MTNYALHSQYSNNSLQYIDDRLYCTIYTFYHTLARIQPENKERKEREKGGEGDTTASR